MVHRQLHRGVPARLFVGGWCAGLPIDDGDAGVRLGKHRVDAAADHGVAEDQFEGHLHVQRVRAATARR